MIDPTQFESTTGLNRRVFTRRFAAASLAAASSLAASTSSPKTVAAETFPIQRAGGSHLKISLNAFSFNASLLANAKDPSVGINLFEVCDFCARLNFDAIDLTGYYFPGYPNVPDDDYVYRLKRHAFDRGLEISGTGVRNDFVSPDSTVRLQSEDLVKRWIETAAKLGCPVIRVFVEAQRPYRHWREAAGEDDREGVQRRMTDSLRRCAEYGQQHGVIVGVQNHGDFLKTGPEHVQLIQRVDHPWCGALVDTGNYKTDDPYKDIALVAPHAVNWQIKQSQGNDADAPLTDMTRLFTVIRQSGFRGNVPIETLSRKRPDYDPMIEIPIVLGEVRRAIEATESIQPLHRD